MALADFNAKSRIWYAYDNKKPKNPQSRMYRFSMGFINELMNQST